MDLIEKNMILQTNNLFINYGEIGNSTHILIGSIRSSLPFTFIVLGDNEPLIPLQHSVDKNPMGELIGHSINVNFQFSTGLITNFQLKLEGTDFDINLKLWKPYPISPVLPNPPSVTSDTPPETVAQSVSEPAAEPSAQPASEPSAQPASEPASEPASDPPAQPASEPASDPAV